MTLLTYIVFGLGAGLQATSAGLAIAYLFGAKRVPVLRAATWTASFALLALAGAFVLRFAQWGVLPLSSGADSILLFTIMSLATAISVSCQAQFRPVLALYLPPLALLTALCALLAVKDFTRGPNPIEVSQTLLFLHVGLAFQAYALFFIASLTSLAYIAQSRRLKLRAGTPGTLRLPSLEDLDRTLHLLVKLGYPIFVVTLLVGLAWARFVSDTLSPTWWFSPKIALSFVMVLFYAASFHSRALGWLRGPKLAYFVFIGFGLLLAVYLLLEVLRLTNYNFWGTATP